jgi:murein DD-endopeptidase MepM/ murein hydrolase activator NlpD
MVIFNDETFEERFIFRLTRLNVFSFFLSLGVIFTLLTFLLIIYTPVKEYIPGYPSEYQRQELIKLNIFADSLEREISTKDLFFENIKKIIEGADFDDDPELEQQQNRYYDSIRFTNSVADSLLRLEFESQNLHNLYSTEADENSSKQVASIRNINFYTPAEGIVTSHFNISKDHFGIDIVSKHNTAIKAILDGTVVFAGWTLETGYIIAIQHEQNIISFYKHNSVLLKKQGDIVSAGEAIAISGASGEMSTGPHLHFELWHNGAAVNPEDYIIFN